MESLSDS
jgi:hypothetical protein